VTELTKQDVQDILYGATLFGAGGGGELSEGLGLIDEAYAAGKTLKMLSLDDVPNDALICTPYLLGAISALPEEEEQLYEGLPKAELHPIRIAYRRLEAHLGQKIFGTVPCELGGSNTAVPFYVAAMEGAVVIDADPAGRAVPEITHSSYYLAGLPAAPIVTANAFGETMVLEHIIDDQRAETVVRALAQVSRNDIAAIDHALPAEALKPAILTGTLSRAQHLGKLWREGKSDPESLPRRIADAASGIVAFEGQITEANWRTDAGFTLGSFTIANGKDTYRIDLKNENMAGWRNGALHATIPEIITVLDMDTGDVVTNPNAKVHQSVAVIILPAPKLFLTPKGLEIFGPSYAGLDAPFKSSL